MIFDIQTARLLYYFIHRRTALKLNLLHIISTNCSAAKQLPQFSNIRNPQIYCVNRYFLMFGGSQVQTPYRASTNGFLTFVP